MLVVFSWLPVGFAANYYVNDGITAADVYTTAIGNDANAGTSPASPKATINSIITTYALSAGDTVFVDTGVYSNQTFSISSADSGSAVDYVYITGSTNGTVIDAVSLPPSVIALSGADYVKLTDLTVRRGRNGVRVTSGSDNCIFENIKGEDCSTAAFQNTSGSNNRYFRCQAERNSLAFEYTAGTGVSWDSGLIISNDFAFKNVNAQVSVSNSIIVGGAVFLGGSDYNGDHNIFWDCVIDTQAQYPKLYDLQKALNRWRRTTYADPLLTGSEKRSQSVIGTYSNGVYVQYTNHSPAIDFAGRSEPFAQEPAPNGSRANAGRYGGTATASKSRTNAWLLALTANDGGHFSGTTNLLYWNYGGFTNGATVKVQFTLNGVMTNWQDIATGVPVTNEFVNWDVSSAGSVSAFWRVQAEAETNVWDANQQFVSVNGGVAQYFVNDTNTAGDVYCSAVGSAQNTGLAPDRPLDRLSTLVKRYKLGGRDEVYVDTGHYRTESVRITSRDTGSLSNGFLTIIGSTNEVAGKSLLEKGDAINEVVRLDGVQYLILKHLRMQGAQNALRVDGDSHNNRFYALEIREASGAAVLNNVGNSNTYDRCTVAESQTGFQLNTGNSLTWNGGLSISNTVAFLNAGTSVTISNSVIVGGTAFDGTGPGSGDYNVFWNLNAIHDDIFYLNLQEFQSDQGGWWNSIVAHPGLADMSAGQYYPLSPEGRYDPAAGAFVTTDTNFSVLVDFGAPSHAYSNEPSPNGARLNAGLYGNTDRASKGHTNAWLQALTYNDGGVLVVPGDTIYWTGGNFATAALVRVEFALDGINYESTPIATGLLASAGSYTWVNTNYPSSTNARWRVVLEDDPVVMDAIDNTFEHKNGPYIYYVNDGSIEGDGPDWGVGDNSNLGLAKSAPKATLKSVLDTYSLSRGDTIFIGNGSYELSSAQAITSTDSGDTNDSVYIIGSTNSLAGGTVFKNYGLALNGAAYISIERIGIQGASIGFDLSNAQTASISRCFAYDCDMGLKVDGGGGNTVEHAVLYDNRLGLNAVSGFIHMSNSVVVAQRDDAFGYRAHAYTAIAGDYNVLFVESNAVSATVIGSGTNIDTLASWSALTGYERHSLDVRPLFADPGSLDFHLKSVAFNGRYVPGTGFVQDAVESPLIDAGPPAYAFSEEPNNNGNRINMGLFGGSWEASKSSGDDYIRTANYSWGGWMKSTGVFHWVAGGAATGHTVLVEISTDGGDHWDTVASGVSADRELQGYNALSTNDSPSCLWRVTSEINASLTDQTTNFFAIRKNPFTLYVNDLSTANDMYCTGVGASTNWPASAARPLNSLKRAVDLFDLEPGDVIYIDTGSYNTNVAVSVGRNDSGSKSAPVQIAGSTNDLPDRTVMHALSLSNAALTLAALEHAVISNITLTVDSATGLHVFNSTNIILEGLFVSSSSNSGALVESSDAIHIHHSSFANNKGYGLVLKNSDGVDLSHCIIWSNLTGCLYHSNGLLNVEQSVLSAVGEDATVYEFQDAADISADYNNIIRYDNAVAGILNGRIFATLSDWQAYSGNDGSSLSHEPAFADPVTMDFHLRTTSLNGRYIPGAGYTGTDIIDTPLVDAGNPLAPYTDETDPDGSRVNIGLYGNTAQSTIRTGAWLVAVSFNDGGRFRGTNELYWLTGGSATGDCVNIQISIDNGVVWSNVATSLCGTNRYQWDSGDNIAPQARWRVIEENSNYWDEVDETFQIDNGAISYYVNDNSTAGDVYTEAVGSSLNSGTDPFTPKASISEVLSAYQIKPGDRIFIDTGSYDLNSTIVFEDLDGDTANVFKVIGSTNEAAGGSTLNGAGAYEGIQINNSEYVEFEHLRLYNTVGSVALTESTNVTLRWIRSEMSGQSYTHYNLTDAVETRFEHCTAVGGSIALAQQEKKSGHMSWDNGVMMSNSYAAVYLEDGSVSMSNSVIWLDGSERYAYYYEVNDGIRADYNNYHLLNGSRVALFPINKSDNLIYENVDRWRLGTTQDVHSLTVDPRFYDAAQADFHLLSQAGRYDSTIGGFTNDAVSSPLIDAGVGIYSNETAFNGGYANIGLYGNSAEASRTPTNSSLALISMNDGGIFAGTDTLYWTAFGAVTGDTASLAYSADDGSNWQDVATVNVADRSYVWNSGSYTSSAFGLLRLVSTSDTNVWDVSDETFYLRNEPLYFYVNDDQTSNDVYTTAVGAPTNSGASPDSPLLSIQGVIDGFDLEGGDIVYVDSGYYNPSAPVVIDLLDAGTVSNRVLIQGSTNYWHQGTVINAYGFDLNQADDIALSHITVTNASVAVDVNNSDRFSGKWLRMVGAVTAVNLTESPDSLFEKVVLSECGTGLDITKSANTIMNHSVIWSNSGYSFAVDTTSDLSLSNSIAVVGDSSAALFNYSLGTVISDYNNVFIRNGAFVAVVDNSPVDVIYDTLADWSRESGNDRHSFSYDPIFADGPAGDFHLKTTYPSGRYDPVNGWTNDAVASLLIDGGAGVFTNEPAPNGSRVNLGLYGNTGEASMTPTNGWLTWLSLNDGGWIRGATNIYWNAGGVATGHIVEILFSADAGNTWTQLISGLSATNGMYHWDSTLVPSTPLGMLRISSTNDPSITGTTSSNGPYTYFSVRNMALTFYVNDASTNGDMYCSTTGSVFNTGASPDSPVYEVNTILARYNLEGGDTVFMDAGMYPYASNISIRTLDAGVGSNYVSLVGSTNIPTAPSTIRNMGIDVVDAEAVRLQYLVITNSPRAVYYENSRYGRLEWIRAVNGTVGFHINDDSDDTYIEHSMAANNTSYALNKGKKSDRVYVNQSVFWMNGSPSVYVDEGLLSISNTVMGQRGDSNYLIYYKDGPLLSDYNNFFVTNGATIGVEKSSPDIQYANVSRWVRDFGQDVHSLSHDPMFADADAYDFHLKTASANGRYVQGSGWVTNDAVTSALIDAGAGGWTNESGANGRRANLGLYGNTPLASLSPTNARFTVITANDGGRIEGVRELSWIAAGAATGHTATIEYSSDDGLSWLTLTSGVSAAQGGMIWNSVSYTSSIVSLWRITSDDQPSISDRTDIRFALRNQPLYFYVNDLSVANDIYTSAQGSSTNLGIYAHAPQSSLQEVIDRWDLEPGDVVYVDNGDYEMAAEISLGYFDAGESTNRLVLQGVTNYCSGETVMRRNVAGTVLSLNWAPGVAVRDIRFTDAGTAVSLLDSPDCLFEWVRWDENETAVYLSKSHNTRFEHCQMVDHSAAGLSFKNTTGVEWNSGVIWSNRRGIAQDSGSSLSLQNSILAAGPESYAISSKSDSPITANYNNYMLHSDGYAVELLGGAAGGGTTRYDSVSTWLSASGQDANSFSMNPQFADVANRDFHLKSVEGRYSDCLGWIATDAVSSPLIDAGNPASEYTNEPAQNGGRLNIGLYGNSTFASKSSTNPFLLAVTFSDGGFASSTQTLSWIAFGEARSGTVTLAYSPDCGSTWTNIASGIQSTNESFTWLSTSVSNTPFASWRVTWDSDGAVFDDADTCFYVRNPRIIYYVNDNAVAGDVYCTDVGSDSNDGISPATPKRTIQAVLDTYDLEAGDIIYVDSGEYSLNQRISVGSGDAGEDGSPVVIQGSTNVFTGSRTILRRSAPTESVFYMYFTAYVELRDLVIQDAYSGVEAYESPNGILRRCTIRNNVSEGLKLNSYSGSWELNNCIVFNNGTNGIWANLSSFSVYSSTIWGDSQLNAIYIDKAAAVISNSILYAIGSSSRIYNMGIGGSIASADYNNYIRDDGAFIAEKVNSAGGNDFYNTLESWLGRTGLDPNSLAHDPLFADEFNGDLHPKSNGGRWNGSVFVQDAAHSPIVDLGDPGLVYDAEPQPNGSNVNMGAYANTYQASKTATNAYLLAVSFNDGGTFSKSNIMRWAAVNVSDAATVQIEFSDNGGLTWSSRATGVPVTNGTFMLDLSDVPLTLNARWRVSGEGSFTNLSDSGDQSFIVKNAAVSYYVNDSDTSGDIFCTAPGHISNVGTNPASPLPSPQAVMQKYTVSAGDTIYIDTGNYQLTNDWIVSELQQGTLSSPIEVKGATNTVLDWNYRGSGFSITDASYVHISDLTIMRGLAGIEMTRSVNCGLYRVVSRDHMGDGVSVGSKTTGTEIEHCLIVSNGAYGVDTSVAGVTILNSVIFANTMGGVYNNKSSVFMTNNIIHASGDVALLYINDGSYRGDYNVFNAVNGAAVTYDVDSDTTYNDLRAWHKASGNEAHSSSFDPLFVDPGSDNYYLQSQAGRWNGTSFVHDAQTSWAIDFGDPTFTNATVEADPLSDRINAGQYGGTPFASRFSTSAPALFMLNLRDGGDISDLYTLYWLYRGIDSNETVTLQYSRNSGVSWSNIVTGIPVSDGSYIWNTTNYASTLNGLLQIYVESDTNVIDDTTNTFVMRNGALVFYVNDSSTNGDVYTTTVGSYSNTGETADSPKADLQDVLDTYDLEAGDIVYIDSGHYVISNNYNITQVDSGSSLEDVYIIGSTNPLAESLIAPYTNTLNGLALSRAQYVTVQYISFSNCFNAVRAYKSSENSFIGMRVTDSKDIAVVFDRSPANRLINSIITRSREEAVSATLGAVSNRIDHCTFWNNATNAVYVQSSSITVSNSIIGVDGFGAVAYSIAPLSGGGGTIEGDYNLFFVTNAAFYVRDESNKVYEGLTEWIALKDQEIHSLTTDPLLADPVNDNFYPASPAGRFWPVSNQYVTTDSLFSSAIDTGSDNAPVNAEPAPNGNRVNVGAYGTTIFASKSDTNRWLLAITANGGGRTEGRFKLVWAGGGMPLTNEVVLDYSYNNGDSWKRIETVAPLQLGDYEYSWNSASQTGGTWVYLSSPVARWRISLVSDTNVYDVIDNRFTVRNYPFVFYLNDDDLAGDVYTSAVGSDTNLGFFANQPMRTLQGMLNLYEFEPGDYVYMDSGVYTNTLIASQDSGGASLPLSIIGSTNAAAATRFENATIAVEASYVYFENITLSNTDLAVEGDFVDANLLTMYNGDVDIDQCQGVVFSNFSMGVGNISLFNVTNVTLNRGQIDGGYVSVQNAENAVIQNLVVFGGLEPGLRIFNASPVYVLNNTIDVGGTAIQQRDESSFTVLSNNILVADGSDAFCVLWSQGAMDADYNNYVTRNNAWIGHVPGGVGVAGQWERLIYWQRETGFDMNSIAREPLFVNAGGGDYHLQTGSPSIDAGSPAFDVGEEPEDNGNRINQGAYGGTPEASTSTLALTAATLDDSGVVRGTNITLRWLYSGYSATNLVDVLYSVDGASSWILLQAGVPILDGNITWDTSAVTNSFNTYWRVQLESNTNIYDISDSGFAVRNESYNFYVNDTNTAGDIFSSAAGAATNNGLSPSAPVLSLHSILDVAAYDTEVGDTVFVDTGYYQLTSNVSVIWSRGQVAGTNYLTIQGSTNWTAGGTVLDRADQSFGASVFDVKASHVKIRNVEIMNANHGINTATNIAVVIEQNVLVSNVVGVKAGHVYELDVVNNVLQNQSLYGVQLIACRTALVENCTFYGDQTACYTASNPVNHIVQNNIFTVLGNNADALSRFSSLNSTFVDYNLYQLGTGARITGTNNNLRQWQIYSGSLGYGEDGNGFDLRSWQMGVWPFVDQSIDGTNLVYSGTSLYVNVLNTALYANVEAGDFHLKSALGRYVPSNNTWVTDALDEHSWAIDGGSPFTDYSNEPHPDGLRVNLGAYGNTEWASLGYTNPVLLTRSMQDGEVLNEDDFTVPLVWYVKGYPSNWTALVEGTGEGNNSTNWVMLTNNVPLNGEVYVWNLQPVHNTYNGRWRVTAIENTNIGDRTDSDFESFQGEFEITGFVRTNGLATIAFIGAWGTEYLIEYSTNVFYPYEFTNQVWIEGASGSGTNVNQKSRYKAPIGGPQFYQDIESSNDLKRWYRVTAFPTNF